MDLAFEEKGFKNWKKLPEVFTSHKISEHYRNSTKLLNNEETTNDIVGVFRHKNKKRKQKTDKYFFKFYKTFSFQPVKVLFFGKIMMIGILIRYWNGARN